MNRAEIIITESRVPGREILNLSPPNWKESRKEMFYLTTQSTHFIYGYMVSDIW